MVITMKMEKKEKKKRRLSPVTRRRDGRYFLFAPFLQQEDGDRERIGKMQREKTDDDQTGFPYLLVLREKQQLPRLLGPFCLVVQVRQR